MGSAPDEGEGMGKYTINIAVPSIGQVMDKVQGEKELPESANGLTGE